MPVKHHKGPHAKSSPFQDGSSPWQACLPLAPSWLPCPRSNWDRRNARFFAFIVGITCPAFKKDFYILTDIISIQFSSTTFNYHYIKEFSLQMLQPMQHMRQIIRWKTASIIAWLLTQAHCTLMESLLEKWNYWKEKLCHNIYAEGTCVRYLTVMCVCVCVCNFTGFQTKKIYAEAKNPVQAIILASVQAARAARKSGHKLLPVDLRTKKQYPA